MLMTICLILMGQVKFLHAQAPQTLEIGPHAGLTTTINDINTWKMFSEVGLEFGGLVRYNYDSRWAFRLDYTHSMVKSTDSIARWRPERDLSFRSTVNDVSLIVEFNFLDYYTGRVGKTISPYLFGGVSAFWFKTSPNLNKEARQQLAHTTDKALLREFNKIWDSSLAKGQSFSIPFGFGCKISLSTHLSTSIEWRMHYTFTDDLDGIHDPYPDDDAHNYFVVRDGGVDANGKPIYEYDIVTGPVGSVIESIDLSDPTGNYHGGQQRGNSQSHDWFGSISVSLTWKIPLPGGTACRIIQY